MDLHIDDLMTKCDKCEGDGQLVNDRPKSQYKPATGARMEFIEEMPCPRCFGRGYKATPTGDAILFLVRKLAQ